MRKAFEVYQLCIVMLVMIVCSSSCSVIKSHLSRHKKKMETSMRKDVPPPVSPGVNNKDSVRHWFVAVSKDRPRRIRNRHNAWFNRDQDYKIIPAVSVSNTFPSHSPQVVQDEPTRSGGFGIAGFVMSFFAWVPVIGVIAIVFSAIGMGKDRPYKGLAIAGLIIAIIGLLIGLAALSM